jgi:hypothetical protein
LQSTTDRRWLLNRCGFDERPSAVDAKELTPGLPPWANFSSVPAVLWRLGFQRRSNPSCSLFSRKKKSPLKLLWRSASTIPSKLQPLLAQKEIPTQASLERGTLAGAKAHVLFAWFGTAEAVP